MIPSGTLYGEDGLAAGQIAEHHPATHITSKISDGRVPFGRLVVKGSGNGDAKLPSAGSDSPLGIAGWSTDAADLDNEAYLDGDPLACVETGIVTAFVEEAVSPGDPVRVRHAEDNRAGYQEWGFSAAKTAASASGLSASDTYGAIVTIDGKAKEVKFDGSAAVTIGAVITEFNTDLGSDGVMELVDGKLRVTSATKGAASKVSITDGNDSADAGVFETLTDANDDAEPAVPGSDDVDPVLSPGNLRTSSVAGATALVSGAEFKSESAGPGLVKVYVKGSLGLTADV